jgi:glutamyl-tRNA synthetase
MKLFYRKHGIAIPAFPHLPILRLRGEDRSAGRAEDEARTAKAPIIQWLPPEHTIPRILHKPDGDLKGYCEPMVALDVGKMVQFERVGFVRIEKATAQIIEVYWGHR